MKVVHIVNNQYIISDQTFNTKSTYAQLSYNIREIS